MSRLISYRYFFFPFEINILIFGVLGENIMENTKISLNDLEAYVSKLTVFVDKLDSDRGELAKKSLGITQKIQKTESANQ
jgi:hypothetical protein